MAGTAERAGRWLAMASDIPPSTDPDDRDHPRTGDEKRGDRAGMSLWLIIGAVALLGVVVYAASAYFVG